MKTLLLILVTVGVTFASAYFVVQNQQAARTQQAVAAKQAAWDKEKAELESALAEAQRKPAPQTLSAAPAANAPAVTRLTPRQILEKLIAIRPGTGAERTRHIRLVVFYLESLTERGTEALPAIREFLARNEDVDYTAIEETAADNAAPAPDPAQNNRNNRQQRNNRGDNIWQFRRGGELRTDFVLPPSLRLGLVDVVRAIGGGDAEKILADMLGTTGRGIEVAYIARVLEELSPGKYRAIAIAAAKDLLTHPPVVDGNSRLDENSKGYLYGVLTMFNDTSFAANAQAMLLGADGRIDRNALGYLNSTMKEMAVPTFYAAYSNPSLTNFQDKASIAGNILNYAGNNQTANQLFNDIMANPDLDSRIKAGTVMRLAGGNFGPFSSESPTDPQIIQARLKLIQNLAAGNTDERLARALENTVNNLNHLAKGEPIENNFGGGRRWQQGGNRDGGGN